MNDLKNKVEHQMPFSVCFPRNSTAWIVFLGLIPVFIYASTSDHNGYCTTLTVLFTSLVFIFSSFLFKFSKQKQLLVKQNDQHPISSEENISHQVEEREENTANSEKETLVLHGSLDKDIIQSPESYSGREIIDQYSSTSEDSDFGWPFSGNADCSDGSISDEESLIEIALPSGHYVGSKEKEEEHKFRFHKKLPDFLPESSFELLEIFDVTEEENLIEIDISVGSIMCSRFEIEA